jgi:hypothetical protein
MYQRHIEEWKQYPDEIKDAVTFFITDDCSTEKPLCSVFKKIDGLDIHAFQILEKRKWNGFSCWNIGAKNCATKWLVITDIDLLIPVDSMTELVRRLRDANIDGNWVYRFRRVDAATGREMKTHSMTLLMTRELYWKIGGFDEEFAGIHVGTTSLYYDRLRKTMGIYDAFVQLDIPFVYHDAFTTGISDAQFNGFARDDENDMIIREQIRERKKVEGREKKIYVLTFPYQKL